MKLIQKTCLKPPKKEIFFLTMIYIYNVVCSLFSNTNFVSLGSRVRDVSSLVVGEIDNDNNLMSFIA